MPLVVAMLFLFGCGGNPEDQITSQKDSVTVDNAVDSTLNSVIDLGLLRRFTFSADLPFESDSLYFENLMLEHDSVLSKADVMYLTYGFLETEISNAASYKLLNFYEIDSIKLSGGYDEYVENLDLGMMKESDAYIDRKIKLDDSTTLLVWYLTYSTYEACPYASGTLLFASVLYDNVVTSSTLIGENSGSGDAPYWGETSTCCHLTENSFSAGKKEMNGGDEDEEGNEIVEKEYAEYGFQIIGGKWLPMDWKII